MARGAGRGVSDVVFGRLRALLVESPVWEDGEIVGAANNFRWNESPIDLLNRFSAATESVPSFSREWGDDYFSRTATPALRIPDFNMSSVSQAL